MMMVIRIIEGLLPVFLITIDGIIKINRWIDIGQYMRFHKNYYEPIHPIPKPTQSNPVPVHLNPADSIVEQPLPAFPIRDGSVSNPVRPSPLKPVPGLVLHANNNDNRPSVRVPGHHRHGGAQSPQRQRSDHALLYPG